MPADFTEVEGLASALIASDDLLAEGAKRIVEQRISNVADVARSIVAANSVESGDTLRSIEWDVKGLTGLAGPTTDYAHYLENGTSKMAPEPFMGPALDHEEPGFEADIAELAASILR